jgi:hypothetical protein
MNPALFATVLIATTIQATPAFARGGGLHPEDPGNPEHISGLPSEVRSRMSTTR